MILELLLKAYQSLVSTRGGASVTRPNSWIFQANPKSYDIDAALHELSELSWLVNQHADQIREKNKVFIWRSGIGSGIVALATILTDPAMATEPQAEQHFNVEKSKFEGPRAGVRLRIDRRVVPTLSRSTILREPKLASLSIITAPQGTNFPVRDEEAAVLLDLISPSIDTLDEPCSS